ncbi:NAD(P)/FAD-dependent oxidoreductase [Coralloluteibacterium stylophorae]|uniref:FAD-dependent oxidoreductase n=1 Tax=Coralloluteibacterium stylophorae TaxID=1776034 RepID=A0A8J7VV03_9GAMM|nr:FAD-dependent oxidoreductase [Coralloluteibacterium stylophorae]MBS7457268.1 FAD-dependent oxidoreductase [Coralloluteibacterium stylophorae]
MADHRLVVVGGGVAGLDLATQLAGKRSGDRTLRVTLIDRETAYVWKPMLHTIAASTADAALQQTVYAAQALSHGFCFEYGEAIGVDRRSRQVRLAPIGANGRAIVPKRTVDYDTLVLAVGSRANDFGTPGVLEHCQSIDDRSAAIAFNDRLRIELLRNVASGSPLTIGIVGGGATGVELAAELVQVANVAERYGIAGATGHLKVVLIESGPRLLAPFPERVAGAATRKLEQLGIEVRVGTRVTAVDEAGFHLEGGETVPAELKVWAAGVKAPPLLDKVMGMERNRAGQLVVGPTLATETDPCIYALGDCASPRFSGRDGPVPTTAQAASQHARYLCRHLPALIAGGRAPPATYRDFGGLVSLGGFDAYGTLGRFGLFDGGFLRGRVAQFGHAMLYRRYQVRLHGLARGTLLWLLDTMGRKVRPPARLS